MKKILSLFLPLLVLSVFSLSSCKKENGVYPSAAEESRVTYLVCGYDDAAENTDVIFLVSADLQSSSASVLQIPRDTYYGSGKGQQKINQIYSHLRSEGKSQNEAMSAFSDAISSTFDLPIDGWFGITTEGVVQSVNALGGITVSLSNDLLITEENGKTLSLLAGENHLSGDEALSFLRFRRGYARGDLGRVDAQKLFLEACFKRMKDGVTLPELLNLLFEVDSRISTNVQKTDFVKTALNFLPKLRNISITYLTLPGEAIQSKTGLWYYVARRASAQNALQKFFQAGMDFDTGNKLTDSNNPDFNDIYNDRNPSFPVYQSETLRDMRIPAKKG